MASYVIIYDSRRWVRSDSTDSTVLLPVVAGGTAADLSSSGGAHFAVWQETAGGAFTSRILGAGDVPDAALTSNVALLNRASQLFTGDPQKVQGKLAVGGNITPQKNLHAVGASGQVAVMPTLGANDVALLENNSNSLLGFIAAAASAGGIKVYASGGAGALGQLTYSTATDTWSVVASGGSKVTVDGNGNVVLNATGSALATGAVNGFSYAPNCAGVPTGVPASLPTGATPIVYDTADNRPYFYNGGWQAVTSTAPDIALSLLAPPNDETITAGYSAVVVRQFTIASAKKLTVGSAARMRIL